MMMNSFKNYALAPVKKKKEYFASENEKKSIEQIRSELDSKLSRTMQNYRELKELHAITLHKPFRHTTRTEERIINPYRSYEDFFDRDYFFLTLEKETVEGIKQKRKKKEEKRKKFTPSIQKIIGMIIDIEEESDKYLKNKQLSLIDIPDWVNWMQSFIDGKFISSDEVENKNKAARKEYNPNDKPISEFTEEEKNVAKYEFYDYCNYMGNWTYYFQTDPKKFDSKTPFKKNVLIPESLKLYDILGNDISFMLSTGKINISGRKEAYLRSMRNEDFEPGTEDYNNVKTCPTYKDNKNFGEILEFFLDIKNESEKNSHKMENILNQVDDGNEPLNEAQNNEEFKNEEIKFNPEEQKEKETIEKKDNKKEEKSPKEESKIEDAFKSIEDKGNLPETLDVNFNEDEEELKFSFRHIPIKLCFTGHSFSGKKTQAQLISEAFPGIKIYTLKNLINEALTEYKKVYTPLEDNPKFKSMKKNQQDQLREEKQKEIDAFKPLKSIINPLIEKYFPPKTEEEEKKEETKKEDKKKEDSKKSKKKTKSDEDEKLPVINIDDLPDLNKIKLILYHIKQDFPIKEQNQIEEELRQIKERMNKIDSEILKIREEMNTKKGAKNKAKEEQSLFAEKEKIINDFYSGFIITDFPKAYSQFKLFEEFCTGFVEEQDKEKNEMEKYHDDLLITVDRSIHSNLLSEVSQSVFNIFVNFKLEDEETLRRVKDRKMDPTTEIIYHMTDNPPPAGDKKLNERLVDVLEPTPEEIQEEMRQFSLSFSQIIEFEELFKNSYNLVGDKPKEEVFEDLKNNVLTKTLERFHNENNVSFEYVANSSNLIVNPNEPNTDRKNEEAEESNVNNVSKLSNKSRRTSRGFNSKGFIQPANTQLNLVALNKKYSKRLGETKKRLNNSEMGKIFLDKWNTFNNEYISKLEKYFMNIGFLKVLIIQKMDAIQKEFCAFINSPSDKKKLIQIFTNKYSDFRHKYLGLIGDQKVKEEFKGDLGELSDCLWGVIQQRKNFAIDKRREIMEDAFIPMHINFFYQNILNIFKSETQKFLLSMNIIKEFYLQFSSDGPKNPMAYSSIFEEIKAEEITNNLESFEIIESSERPYIDDEGIERKEIVVNYPKIERLYLNCYKIIFRVDYLIRKLEEPFKAYQSLLNSTPNAANNNSSMDASKLMGKKSRGKRRLDYQNDSFLSIDGKEAFTLPNEIKETIENEKNKFKFRIATVKEYAIAVLKNITLISTNTYNLIDEWIIDSVSYQNKAMNNLIQHLTSIVDSGSNMQWDFELDSFSNKFKMNTFRFDTDTFFSELNTTDEYDDYNSREIDYSGYVDFLKRNYNDLKYFIIQKNFIPLENIKQIFIKRHLCPLPYEQIYLSPLFKLTNKEILTFFDKLSFVGKGRNDLIDLKYFMCLFLVIGFDILTDEKVIYSQIEDKLKNHCYLSQDDFLSINFWFEEDENNFNESYIAKYFKKNDELPRRNYVKELLYEHSFYIFILYLF
ncbi:MAG: hypothetical protein MJ252_08540, partial [archaeon]|nr:hypothetical protein [archaeon]